MDALIGRKEREKEKGKRVCEVWRGWRGGWLEEGVWGERERE